MRQDILLDNNNDLQLYNGDFVTDNSDQQHVEHIVHAQKGEYKNYPITGFGVVNYLKKTNRVKSDFKRDLKIQLENDNYQNPKIDLSDGFENLKIEV